MISGSGQQIKQKMNHQPRQKPRQQIKPSQHYVVELESVSKEFERFSEKVQALKDVDLKIQPRDQIVITGTSGSGKSTLLHIIGTLDRPTRGSVAIDGREVAKMPEHVVSNFRNSKVGFVFQMNNLLSEFSAIENVMIPGLIAGVPHKDVRERARHLLRAVSLDDRKNHRPRELSGGEQQRVAIARALLMDPGILLADEPTGNLDQKTSQLVFELLTSMCKTHNTTMLLITHDPELARCFDKKVVMEDGRILKKEGVL